MDENSTEGGGIEWGGFADKALDTIGKLLTLDAAREQSRLDNRLSETRFQAELYGIPYRPMNAQANGQSYTSGATGGNSWLVPVVVLVGLFVAYQAVK